jgi:proline dehydrogenase
VGLFDRAVVRILPLVPRAVVRRVSAPYIAGPTLEDARRTVAALAREGKLATIDVLGEVVRAPDEARAIAAAYHEALAMLDEGGHEPNVSVKLTALGLTLDRGLCRELTETVVRDATERSGFVRIDMEDSSCTDDTLALYRGLREAGLDRVGIVLQSVLRRTLGDVADLADLVPNVRICKGIYVEPPAVAFRDPAVVRRCFVSVLEALLAAGAYAAIATHDEELLAASLARVEGLPATGYELQMLLGVREARATELVAAGHRLRVYVPYGSRWYEYSLRRLQENPAVAGHVAGDIVRRRLPRRR